MAATVAGAAAEEEPGLTRRAVIVLAVFNLTCLIALVGLLVWLRVWAAI